MRFIYHLLTTLILTLSVPARAQDDSEPTPIDIEQAVIREATAYMDRLEMRRAAGDAVVERIERPLLTFGDKARDNSNGTLWAWGKSGRPLAFLELYRGLTPDAPWANAFTLTGLELVATKTTVATSWQPRRPQIEPQLLPDAPAPDPKANVRLRQMKEQARRFSAHEFWDPDNSRFELRLLVQPVLRYKESKGQVQDGAAFLLAHGTNPEIIVLVEALGETLEKARWHYSAARMGSAEMHLEIDGKVVWKQDRTPGVVGKPTDPFWLFMSQP